jgi:hypothetical protein
MKLALFPLSFPSQRNKECCVGCVRDRMVREFTSRSLAGPGSDMLAP